MNSYLALGIGILFYVFVLGFVYCAWYGIPNIFCYYNTCSWYCIFVIFNVYLCMVMCICAKYCIIVLGAVFLVRDSAYLCFVSCICYWFYIFFLELCFVRT